MANNGRKNRKLTPESRFYDTLKGEQVRVMLARDGSEVTATLLWVDRYSLGLRNEDGEFLLNKGSIETIELAMRKRHGDHRGATV